MDSSLTQIIYYSTAAKDFDKAELDRLLATSVLLNSIACITGMLIYKKGSFMQVLEGPDSEVIATFGRICNDPRHHTIMEVSRLPIAERNFPHWSMGFHQVTPADVENNPSYAQLASLEQNTSGLPDSKCSAVQLLINFSRC